MAKKKKDPQPSLFPEPENKVRDDFPISRPQARTEDPDTSHIWAKYLNVKDTAEKSIVALLQVGPMHSYRCADEIGITIANVSSVFRRLFVDKLVIRTHKNENKWVSELTPLGREIALRLIKKKE